MAISSTIPAAILATALAAFSVPVAAIATNPLDDNITSGGNYVAPVDKTIYMTYGTSQVFTATYTTQVNLGDDVQATWTGGGLSFDPTTLTVSCEKKTETSEITGVTTTYFVYTTTVKGVASAAGVTTLTATIGGYTAAIGGESSATIKIAKKRIAVPAADKTTFVYQKDLKQYPTVAVSDDYTVAIPADSIEKGSYSLVISLKDTFNTEWATVDEDGKDLSNDSADKTITYSIVDRDYQAELEALQTEYDKVANDLANYQQTIAAAKGNYKAVKVKNTSGKTIKVKVHDPSTGKYTKVIKIKKGKTIKISKYANIAPATTTAAGDNF